VDYLVIRHDWSSFSFTFASISVSPVLLTTKSALNVSFLANTNNKQQPVGEQFNL